MENNNEPTTKRRALGRGLEELFYNDFNPIHNKIIRNYQDCFLAYVNAYYRTISTNYITNNYYKSYIPYKPFMEIINEN
jgi:hypothetical protein